VSQPLTAKVERSGLLTHIAATAQEVITIGRFKSVEAVPTMLQFFAPGVSSVQSGHMVSLGKLRANVPEFASWTISNASSNEYRPASARRFVYP
jgi:hypothetical protein